jgi:hypothetical protein
MDPICLLIESVVIEICSLYIAHKWGVLTGGFRAKPQTAPKNLKRPVR